MWFKLQNSDKFLTLTKVSFLPLLMFRVLVVYWTMSDHNFSSFKVKNCFLSNLQFKNKCLENIFKCKGMYWNSYKCITQEKVDLFKKFFECFWSWRLKSKKKLSKNSIDIINAWKI